MNSAKIKTNAKFYVGDVVTVPGFDSPHVVIDVERWFKYRTCNGHGSPRLAIVCLDTPLSKDIEFIGEEFTYCLSMDINAYTKQRRRERELTLVERGWNWRQQHGEKLYALVRSPSTCPKEIVFMHGKLADVKAEAQARNKSVRKSPYVPLLVKKAKNITKKGMP